MPERSSSDPKPASPPAGCGEDSGLGTALPALTIQAFQLRSTQLYALHPVDAALQYHRAQAEIFGEEGHGGCGFVQAEAHYRAGAQGLRLSEIPQLPQQFRQLSRLSAVDRAGRKALRKWAEDYGHVFDEASFLSHWEEQEKRGGTEHHVYYNQDTGRWIKRLYHGVAEYWRSLSRNGNLKTEALIRLLKSAAPPHR